VRANPDDKPILDDDDSLSASGLSLDLDVFDYEPPQPGRLLAGRYRLDREVGRGGMAVVYEAHDEKLDDVRVAVKVLPPALARSPGAVARLKREAITAMSLSHPNIVRVHGFDDDVDVCFLVMEFLDGPSLDTVVTRHGALPLPEVLEVARYAAAGLTAAHEQRVVHRDVKPANLMYATVAGRQVVKVTDFGIAYELHDTLSRLTGSFGSGTLLYMAPEQLEGGMPDARSDEYSLAVTLYELAAGRPPFFGRNAIEAIVCGEPTPIPGVPDHVNGALLRGMAKDADDRFADVEALLDGLLGASPRRRELLAAMVPPTAEACERTFVNDVGMRMVWIPRGRFAMGSPDDETGRWPDEGPVTAVEVTEGFWIAESPVTEEQYDRVLAERPAGGIAAERPVAGVNWFDACAFCRRLTDLDGYDMVYRLPSEAQWEYACRAGEATATCGGHSVDAVAWYADNSGGSVQPVRRRHPNAWGLYDMLGNLWEWCRDGWHPDHGARPPTAAPWPGTTDGRRVLRGGAWNCFERSCRCAARHACLPGLRLPVFGFRCVAVPRLR